jgi:hypothetical protein
LGALLLSLVTRPLYPVCKWQVAGLAAPSHSTQQSAYRPRPSPVRAVMAARRRPRFKCSGLTPAGLHAHVITIERAGQRRARTVASLRAARVPYTVFKGTDGAQVLDHTSTGRSRWVRLCVCVCVGMSLFSHPVPICAQPMAPELLNAFFTQQRIQDASKLVDPRTGTVPPATVDAFKCALITVVLAHLPQGGSLECASDKRTARRFLSSSLCEEQPSHLTARARSAQPEIKV